MKLYKVTLLAEERAELEAITHKGSHQSQKVINALILLNCDEGEFNALRPRGEECLNFSLSQMMSSFHSAFSKFHIVVMLISAGIFFTGNVAAQNIPEKLRIHQCEACHTLDTRLIGPSWLQIIAKYKDVQNAAQIIADNIKKGGRGSWGSLPCPSGSTSATSSQIGALAIYLASPTEFDAAEAKRISAEAIAQAARQREEEKKLAAFRKAIQEGDDTTNGVVVQVKGNLVKIQTNESQCSQRDYNGSCTNYINTPAEKWFKRNEVYPQ